MFPFLIPVLSDSEVRTLITPEDAIRVIEETYADYGRTRRILSMPPAMLMPALSPGTADFKVKGAHVPGKGIAGFRMIADGRTDEATIDTCWVAEAATGRLIGLVDETWLHRLRTGMTGIVAARLLANPGSRVAAIIGAGQIADVLPAGLKAAFALDEVRIASRRPETSRAFAERHRETAPLRAVESVDEAVEGADIVIAITSADKPVLHGRHLRPGMTVCGLGGGPEIALDAFWRANRFVVDDLEYACTIGSVRGWLASGLDRETLNQRLAADIGEVADSRKPGRTGPDEVVLAIIQGMACRDVALAHLALERASASRALAEAGA